MYIYDVVVHTLGVLGDLDEREHRALGIFGHLSRPKNGTYRHTEILHRHLPFVCDGVGQFCC